MTDKKAVGIKLVFHRRGSGDPETFSYSGVNRNQTVWDNAGHRTIVITMDNEVHRHSETDDYRLVRMSKYFA